MPLNEKIMGARKRISAEKRKEAKKVTAIAVLKNCPTSPRKMRLVADMIRGVEVNNALNLLKYSSKEASNSLEKLVMSAVANWQQKNTGARIEDSNVVVSEVYVDGGRMLKRVSPAPQGRAYRKRKRSNHITVVLGTDKNAVVAEEKVNN